MNLKLILQYIFSFYYRNKLILQYILLSLFHLYSIILLGQKEIRTPTGLYPDN